MNHFPKAENRSNEKRALYFPYMRLPETDWSIRTILYWDDVAVIVPYEYRDDRDWLGDYTFNLLEARLIHHVHPGEFLWKAKNFGAAFLESLMPFAELRRSTASSWVRIHMEKMHDAADGLCELGLARREKPGEYDPWYLVEAKTASDFMAYLAGVLGQIPNGPLVPVTDQATYLYEFLPQAPDPHDRAGDDSTIELLREQTLERLLPAPLILVDPSDLRDFKEEHHELLTRFRAHIEGKIMQLAALPDTPLRHDAVEATINELISERDEIAARMSERRWPFDLGTLLSLVPVGVGGLQSVVQHQLEFGVPVALAGLAKLVYEGHQGVSRKLESAPLAYAAIAEDRFSSGQ